MNSSLEKKLSSSTSLRVSTGDRFLLGNHLLACGDSCSEDIVNRLFSEVQKAQLILTDPPYGVAYVESKKDFIGNTDRHIPIENDELQTDASYCEFTKSWLAPIL